MADIYMPSDEAELSSFVEAAKAGNYPLEVCGFRSKREAGRPVNPAAVVSTAKLSGITFYEPGMALLIRAPTEFHYQLSGLYGSGK